MKDKKNPICSIMWHDAAYTFEKKVPREFPRPQLTTGFIISADERSINIATNVAYSEKHKKLTAIDGFVIPAKSKIKFKKVGYFD